MWNHYLMKSKKMIVVQHQWMTIQLIQHNISWPIIPLHIILCPNNTTTSQYPSFVENAHNPPLRTSTIITNEDQVLNEDDININDDNLHTTAATSPIIVKPTPITILPRKRHIIGDSASSPSLYNSKDFSSSTISLKTPRLHSDDTNLPTTTKIDGSSFLDSDDIFGQHVAISMRGMDNQHTKEYFKLKVQELIYQVQFGERLWWDLYYLFFSSIISLL